MEVNEILATNNFRYIGCLKAHNRLYKLHGLATPRDVDHWLKRHRRLNGDKLVIDSRNGAFILYDRGPKYSELWRGRMDIFNFLAGKFKLAGEIIRP